MSLESMPHLLHPLRLTLIRSHMQWKSSHPGSQKLLFGKSAAAPFGVFNMHIIIRSIETDCEAVLVASMHFRAWTSAWMLKYQVV